MSIKVLFLLKQRQGYGVTTSFSSGLFNSARFASDMLQANGIQTNLIEVVDGNSIDREVSLYRPSHVIIEALWVTPEKLQELARLHPSVRWIVRFHSDPPFLALESVAVRWLKAYIQIPRVYVAANRLLTTVDFLDIAETSVLPAGKVLLLPTFYPPGNPQLKKFLAGKILSVSCPGAIRPFKNHLNQAIAAMRFAESTHRVLNFHVNGSRVEQGGGAVLQNLEALFAGTPHHLIIEPWTEHAGFVDFLRKMDLGMQVSFTETFDICAADMVTAGIPMVVSPQVYWASKSAMASPVDVEDIYGKIVRVVRDKDSSEIFRASLRGLRDNARMATDQWLKALRTT